MLALIKKLVKKRSKGVYLCLAAVSLVLVLISTSYSGNGKNIIVGEASSSSSASFSSLTKEQQQQRKVEDDPLSGSFSKQPKPMSWQSQSQTASENQLRDEVVKGPNRALKDKVTSSRASSSHDDHDREIKGQQQNASIAKSPPASLASEIRSVLEADVQKNKLQRKKLAQEKFLHFRGKGSMRIPVLNNNNKAKVIKQKPIFTFRDLGPNAKSTRGTNDNPIDFAVRQVIGRLQRELGPIGERLDQQTAVINKQQPSFLDASEAPSHTFIPGGAAPGFHVGDKLPPKFVRQVLIATTWRSGSTFLGDLINHYPGVFYSFEPLHFNSYHANTASPPVKLLESLYACQFGGANMAGYLKHAAKHQFLFLNHNHRLAKVCEHVLPAKSACFLPSLYQRSCPLFPINAVKTVRLRVAETEKLMVNPSFPNFKVIVLVRDPRGVMNSRSSMDWCEKDQCANPATVCEHLKSDVESAFRLKERYPDKVHLVRYEDLAVEPGEVADDLLRFLDLPQSEAIDKFIEEHTKAPKKKKDPKTKRVKIKGNPYGTYRESKHTAFAWKTKMKFDYVEEIQGFCQEPMSTLGYNLLATKRDKYNPDFPLVVKEKCDLWPYPREHCDPEAEVMTNATTTPGRTSTPPPVSNRKKMKVPLYMKLLKKQKKRNKSVNDLTIDFDQNQNMNMLL